MESGDLLQINGTARALSMLDQKIDDVVGDDKDAREWRNSRTRKTAREPRSVWPLMMLSDCDVDIGWYLIEPSGDLR